MVTSQSDDKCALPRCTCAVASGERYCCDACKDEHASGDQSEQCPCGHAECTSNGPSGGVEV